MSTTNASQNTPVEHLIESRLDAMDRALLGLVGRSDRLAIVAQVETRIRELAAAGSALETFANELPPTPALGAAARGDATTGARGISPPRIPRSRLAVSSGVLGIVALALLVLSPIFYLLVSVLPANESVLLPLLGVHVTSLALGGFLAVALGITALVLISRRDGRLIGAGWAITGLCTGPLPMLLGGLVALVALAQLSDTVSVTTVYTANAAPVMNPYGPPDGPVSQTYSVPSPYTPDLQPGPVTPPSAGFVPPSNPVPEGSTPTTGSQGYPAGNAPQETAPSLPAAAPSVPATFERLPRP